METIIVYVKKNGFNTYYRVEYLLHKSNRGYKIAAPRFVKEITKYRYYKDTFIPHYTVYNQWKPIHEIGNEKFFNRIGY